MCKYNEFIKKLEIKERIPFSAWRYFPEPLAETAFMYKRWYRAALEEKSPGKAFFRCAVINTLYKRDAYFVKTAIEMMNCCDEQFEGTMRRLVGMAMCEIGETEGLEYIRKGVELCNGLPQRLGLASALTDFDKTEECIEICKNILQNNPDEIRAMRILSAVLIDMGDLNKAQEIIQNALALAPKDKTLIEMQANIFFEVRNFKEAIKLYKKAQRLINFSYFIAYKMACAYYHMGCYRKSKKQIAKIKESTFKYSPYFRDNEEEIRKQIEKMKSAK